MDRYTPLSDFEVSTANPFLARFADNRPFPYFIASATVLSAVVCIYLGTDRLKLEGAKRGDVACNSSRSIVLFNIQSSNAVLWGLLSERPKPITEGS